MYKKEYERWLSKQLEDKDLAPELLSIQGNEEEIKDRFAVELAFGTAGLRGVIGAGTNRMNIYVVRKATQGLANYLNKQKAKNSVAISFDSRIKSDVFSKTAAEVLAANGIAVHIYKELMPVPALSFATRYLHCDAGIMVTASHNPAKYNGYKAYGPDGCQMTTEAADAVYAEIQNTDIFDDVKTMPFDEAMEQGIIKYIGEGVTEALYDNIKAQSVRPNLCKSAGLKLVYTPLNGSGNVPVRRVLGDIGIDDITVVPEQEYPDGHFPTCPYPNPEIKEALAKGLALAEKTGADLLLATDPDADRVGIAVKDEDGSYKLLSGNEVGVLLLDYICAARIENKTMPKNPIMVKSIVTTNLADEVAKSYGVEPINVLTGFKFIGEQILLLEQKGEAERFVFGFEESYGYLSGTYVRDKDAIVASMLICEMAAYYKSVGSSVLKALEEIYTKFGRYLHKVDSFEFEGLAGMDKMKAIMADLRANAPKAIGGYSVVKIADYQTHEMTDVMAGQTQKIELPAANVLTYYLDNGANVIVRPSGTEPKIKVYYSTKGVNLAQADALRTELAQQMNKLLGF
ncbi:MAG: phospho-sugar mutase [Oscillospiraceae bacterium]|nr:phospho-sugar mutase [Oscillospiraceae bacterium]